MNDVFIKIDVLYTLMFSFKGNILISTAFYKLNGLKLLFLHFTNSNKTTNQSRLQNLPSAHHSREKIKVYLDLPIKFWLDLRSDGNHHLDLPAELTFHLGLLTGILSGQIHQFTTEAFMNHPLS